MILLVGPLLAFGVGRLGLLLGLVGATTTGVLGHRFLSSIVGPGSVRLGAHRSLTIRGPQGLVRSVSADRVAWAYDASSRRAVVLLMRDGSEFVARLDRDDVRRVLEHLSIGPTQRALSLPLRRTLGAFTIGFVSFWPLLFAFAVGLAAVAPTSHAHGVLVALALAASSTAALVARFGFPRVVIGTDGVRLSGLARERFLPYDQITSARLVPRWGNDPGVVHVALDDGDVIVLPTVAAPQERLEAIARRIEAGARAHASGGTHRFHALGRSGRSAAAWKADVTRLARTPAGFRDQALERDDFERVLADPSAAPDERVGAALALHALDPEGAPPRIRVAAEASADEALRDALAAAAEGELQDQALVLAEARRAQR